MRGKVYKEKCLVYQRKVKTNKTMSLLIKPNYGIEANNMEFVCCHSFLGRSIYGDNIHSTYEYDIQQILLTLCNLNVGLEDTLESINESFNDFSKKLDSAEGKFNIFDTKIKEINKVLCKFTTELHLNIRRKQR